MMTPATILEAFLGFVAIIALLASTVAYFQTQKSKATITIQQQTIDALESQNRAYESRDRARQQENTRLRERITAVEVENGSLREMVQGRDAIARMTEMLVQHMKDVDRMHLSMQERDSAMIQHLNTVNNMLGSLTRKLEGGDARGRAG